MSLSANGSSLLVATPAYGVTEAASVTGGAFMHYINAGPDQGFVPVGTAYVHWWQNKVQSLFSYSLKVSGDGRTVLATSLITAQGAWTPAYFTTLTCVR